MRELEALLRCPRCGAGVAVAEVVSCASGAHRYPVVEGIPVFVDQSTVHADPQYAGQRTYFDAEFGRYERYALENWRVAYLDRLRAAGLLQGLVATSLTSASAGLGYTVIEAARAGRPAIGCDLSLQGLLTARKFAQREGVGERTLWICCSAEQLPLASGAFGAALAIAVLEHVPDDDRRSASSHGC